jgi:hypothetical protein
MLLHFLLHSFPRNSILQSINVSYLIYFPFSKITYERICRTSDDEDLEEGNEKIGDKKPPILKKAIPLSSSSSEDDEEEGLGSSSKGKTIILQ